MRCDRVLRTVVLMAILGVGAGVFSPAGAQGTPPPRSAAPPGRPAPPDAEMRAAMEQVMMVRLKQVLQLTPEQEPRVMPKVQHMVDARREYSLRRRGAVSHLRALLADETADDAAVEKGLRDLEKIDQSFREQEQGLRRDLSADLTPRQEARMYFFAQHFRRAMQHRMQEATERRRAGLPPASPAPEADDDPLHDEEP